MRITFLTALSFCAVFRHSYIDNYNILWYMRIIQLFVHHLQVYDLHRTRC